MLKLLVCKTVVAYGQGQTKYILFKTDDRWKSFDSIGDLVQYLKKESGQKDRLLLKCDSPGDVLWVRDDTLADRVLELERLSKDEVRELAKMLKK